MKSYPLSLIDDNEDNSSQTHISSYKPKKSIKEDDISTENTLNNNKRNIFKDKPFNEKVFKINHPQKMVFDFKNKFPKENSSISKNTSDIKINANLIDDSNEETKKTKSMEEKIPENKINDQQQNVPKDKLAKNLLEKRDKKFSYHGKIYFFLAISMLTYQYLSYIYLIELPIIQRK